MVSPRDAMIVEYKKPTCCSTIEEDIKFMLSKDKTGKDPAQIIISEADFEANPIQFNGGINVSDRIGPIINDSILATYLSVGTYYLIMDIGDETKAIEIDLAKAMGVANRKITLDVSSFNVMKTGTLEFAIVTSEPNNTNRYAVMDMKGQVITAGILNNSTTRVKVPTTGSYIVKVGMDYKRVNVK